MAEEWQKVPEEMLEELIGCKDQIEKQSGMKFSTFVPEKYMEIDSEADAQTLEVFYKVSAPGTEAEYETYGAHAVITKTSEDGNISIQVKQLTEQRIQREEGLGSEWSDWQKVDSSTQDQFLACKRNIEQWQQKEYNIFEPFRYQQRNTAERVEYIVEYHIDGSKMLPVFLSISDAGQVILNDVKEEAQFLPPKVPGLEMPRKDINLTPPKRPEPGSMVPPLKALDVGVIAGFDTIGRFGGNFGAVSHEQGKIEIQWGGSAVSPINLDVRHVDFINMWEDKLTGINSQFVNFEEKISMVSTAMDELMAYRKEIDGIGKDNKDKVKGMQAKIIGVIDELIKEFENHQISFISSSKVHIDQYRQMLLGLQAKFKASIQDITKLEQDFIAREAVERKQYEFKLADYNKKKVQNETDVSIKKKEMNLKMVIHDQQHQSKIEVEMLKSQEKQQLIDQDKAARLAEITSVWKSKMNVLELNYIAKWKELKALRTKITDDRNKFDISLSGAIEYFQQKVMLLKDKISKKQQTWEIALQEETASYTKQIDLQIEMLKFEFYRQEKEMQLKYSTEIELLTRTKEKLQIQIYNERQEQDKQRAEWQSKMAQLDHDHESLLVAEREKWHVQIDNSAYIALKGEIEVQLNTIRQLEMEISATQSQLTLLIESNDQRDANQKAEGEAIIAREHDNYMTKFTTEVNRLKQMIIDLDGVQKVKIGDWQAKKAEYQLMIKDLRNKIEAWDQRLIDIKSFIEGWTPVYDISILDQEMTIPCRYIHCCHDSALDKHFRTSNRAGRTEADGKIYLKGKDPRIFRMLISYIKSGGQIDMSPNGPLNQQDIGLLQAELDHWGITKEAAQAAYPNFHVQHDDYSGSCGTPEWQNLIDAARMKQNTQITLKTNTTIQTHGAAAPTSGLVGGNFRADQQAPEVKAVTGIKKTYTTTSAMELEAQAISNVIDTMWDTYDKDGSGALDRKEAESFIRSTTSCLKDRIGNDADQVSSEAIQKTFDDIDVDHNGSLDKDEITACIKKVLEGAMLITDQSSKVIDML